MKCFIVLFSLSPGSRGSDSPGPANGDTTTEAELELPQVDATVQRLLESGIAPSTTSAYRSAHRRFTSFCSAAGLVPFPLKEATVCRFVAHLFQTIPRAPSGSISVASSFTRLPMEGTTLVLTPAVVCITLTWCGSVITSLQPAYSLPCDDQGTGLAVPSLVNTGNFI